jgi:hypothetical protein
MLSKSIGRRLILGAVVGLLAACGTRPIADPPPQTPANAEGTSPDAGLPPVPLTRKGVVLPSDVKLDPEPKPVAQPPGTPSAAAVPTAN